jgi:hypothetical protein
MKITRTNLILILTLAFQLVAIVGLSLTNTQPVESSRGPLLSGFEPTKITSVVITEGQDKDKKTIKLTQNSKGDWVLPEFGDYPVDSLRVVNFLNNLKALDTRRLIAQGSGSFARLKVANEAYDRIVELSGSGVPNVKLYMGSANEANASYARLDGQNAAYLSTGVSVFSIGSTASSWVNTTYFSLTQAEVTTLKVENANGTFEFVKQNGNWTLIGLGADERFNSDKFNGLLSTASSLTLSQPLGAKAEDRYGLGKPAATVTILNRKEIVPTAIPTASGTRPGDTFVNPPTATPGISPTVAARIEDTTYILQFGTKQDNSEYPLKASNNNFFVSVSAGIADSFLTLNRDALVVKVTATPTLIPTLPPTPTLPPPPPLGTAIPSFPATPAAIATVPALAPTNTAIPATNTAVPPTNTVIAPTNTALPPTNTALPPTNTAIPATATELPTSPTPIPPTSTPLPPTETPTPSATP